VLKARFFYGPEIFSQSALACHGWYYYPLEMNPEPKTYGGAGDTRGRRLPPRLTGRFDFSRVTRNGRRSRVAFLQIAFRETRNRLGNLREGRIGFTVPDRVCRRAVDRNRIKRLLREAVRRWWYSVKPGIDVVLIVKAYPSTDHADFVEMIFLELILKAGIVRESEIPALRDLLKKNREKSG